MNLKVWGLGLFLLYSPLHATAQEKPIVVSNEDTSYVADTTLEEIIITDEKKVPKNLNLARKSLSHGDILQELMKTSFVTSTFPGVTSDTHRDVRGGSNVFLENGTPLVTSIQNNNLGSSLPFVNYDVQVREPTAKYSSSDFSMVVDQRYEEGQDAIVLPIRQGLGYARNLKPLKFAATLERSSAPQFMEEYIPEMDAIADIYNGHLAAFLDMKDADVEAVVHFTDSNNNFGDLFGAEKYEEKDFQNYMLFNADIPSDIGELALGYAGQRGKNERNVIQEHKSFNERTSLSLHTIRGGIKGEKGEISIMYHWLDKSTEDFSKELQGLQALGSKKVMLSDFAYLGLESKLEKMGDIFNVSGSADLMVELDNFEILLKGGHIYDPLTAENVGNRITREIEEFEPSLTDYAMVEASYKRKAFESSVSLMKKRINSSWYGLPARIDGEVARVQASNTYGDERYLSWHLRTTLRNLELDSNGEKRSLPGSSRLQAEGSIELGSGSIGASLTAIYHSGRSQPVDSGLVADLGNQLIVNLGVTKNIGNFSFGLTAGNIPYLFGHKSKMAAYEVTKMTDEGPERDTESLTLPFIPGVSVKLDM